MLIKGILLALMISILVGPVFFMLLQIAVDKGWKSALYFCSGVWLSDIIYLNVAHYGMSLIGVYFDATMFRQNMGYLGAVVLVVFGVVSFFGKEKPLVSGNEELRARNILFLGVKGFAINSLNPFLFIFWMGIMASLGISNSFDFWWFLVGFILVIMLTDILKIYLANIIRKKLRSVHLLYFRKIGGIVMILFGLYLLYNTLVG